MISFKRRLFRPGHGFFLPLANAGLFVKRIGVYDILPFRWETCTGVIDLHSHILPGIDDGAPDISVSLEMARMAAAGGVTVQACTPHIVPGVYNNNGPQIRQAIADLQAAIDAEGIDLRLVTGADVHLVPDLVSGLRSGQLLTLADSRYLLVEPPHHVAPVRIVDQFFNLMIAGYQPILTHPERLTWISGQYSIMEQLVDGGVWMQITASSLTGAFGKNPLYWAERMLDEGKVHIIATDTHDTRRRPPNLLQGFEYAAKRVGEAEATHMVVTRPAAVLANELPSASPVPVKRVPSARPSHEKSSAPARYPRSGKSRRRSGLSGFLGRVRGFLKF